jgi:hypothetical protein
MTPLVGGGLWRGQYLSREPSGLAYGRVPWAREQPASARWGATQVPADLREALIAITTALDARKDMTRLARNEFVWSVDDAKRR